MNQPHKNVSGSHIETSPVDDVPEQNGHLTEEDTDDISYEERAQFAGVAADEDDELVTTDELIDSPSTAKARGAENSPLSRLGLVAGSLGAIALVIWGLSSFFTGGSQQAQDTEEESPLPAESASTFGEDDQMRAELALIEQQRDEPQQRIAETPRRRPQEAAATESSETSLPTTTRVSSSQPTPTPPRPAATPPPQPAASPTTISRQPSTPVPTEEIEETDPLEQWGRLSTIGSSGAEVALSPRSEIEADNISLDSDTSSAGDPQPVLQPKEESSEPFPFPSDTVGDDPLPLSSRPETADSRLAEERSGSGVLVASMTPGTRGIIQQQPSAEASGELEATRIQQVAMGTSTEGEVVVPIVYAGGEVSARGRFAIELSEPLMDTNDEVALEAGTILITQLTEILEANILRQQVVAIVYRDAEGQVRQEAIEPGVLIIRGDNNQPLVAQVRNDAGGKRFGEDLLVGALSALGNIGAVLNAPDAVTTATSGATGGSTTTSSTTTVTSGQDQDVIAAALEGFFTPVSERVAKRFEQQNQATTSPYLFVPEGQKVSVFVNGLLEVVR